MTNVIRQYQDNEKNFNRHKVQIGKFTVQTSGHLQRQVTLSLTTIYDHVG